MNFNYNLKLLPHQKKFLNSKAKEVALVAGYGGGKTFAGCCKSLFQTMRDPKMLHAIVSPSYKMAKKTILPTMEGIFETQFDPPLRKNMHYTYNKTDFVYDFGLWGGKLIIVSGQDPDSLKGPNLASFGVDEPGIQDKKVREQMIARLREPRAKHRCGFYFGTPEGINHYADLVEGEDRPEDFEDIRANTRDNKFLPVDYIETMLSSYDEQLIDAYINGKFVNMASGSAYHAFTEENVIDKYQFDPYLDIMIGMDFNYTPNTAIACQELPDGRVIAFKEFYYGNCDTDAKCERILSWFESECEYLKVNPLELRYIIFPDAAANHKSAHGVGKTDVTMVRNAFTGTNYSIQIRRANPKRVDRLNAVNGLLCNSRRERRLFITKDCKKTIKDLRQIPRDEFLNSNIEDPDLGHITDGLGYMAEYRYPVKTDWRNFQGAESKFQF